MFNLAKSKNKFEEKQIEDFVSSYRASFRVSFPTSVDLNNGQKLGKTEQSQKVSVGEMAIEILKRDYAKIIIFKSKTVNQAREKLSICYGVSEANNFIERIKI